MYEIRCVRVKRLYINLVASGYDIWKASALREVFNVTKYIEINGINYTFIKPMYIYGPAQTTVWLL